MKLSTKISEIPELFYLDKDDMLLTNFWNSLYIAFLLLPIGINLPTPFFIISAGIGVINIFRFRQRPIKDNRALLLFPLYFLVLLCSLLYTQNMVMGLDLLQRSLSLLIFPVVFLFVKEDAAKVKRLFDFLLIGLIISFVINFGSCIYYVVQHSIKISEVPFLEQIYQIKDLLVEYKFSRLVNSNYVSVYILLVLSYYLKKNIDRPERFSIVLILFFYLFVLASWASCITIIITSLLLIKNINDRSKKFMALVIMILGTIVFLNNPRLKNFLTGIEGPSKELGSASHSIENARLLTWHASLLLIKDEPIFGYGLGDANDQLVAKYKELGYEKNFTNRYNAHNQFFQTWLQTGVFGMIVLISIFVVLGLRMRSSPNELSVFLILLISLLFESMLVRFNGIVFFSIIVSLLLKRRSILGGRIIRN